MPRRFLRSIVEWFYAILSLFTLPWKDLILKRNSEQSKIGVVNMLPVGSGHQEYVTSFVSEIREGNPNVKIYIFRQFYGMNFWSLKLKPFDIINYPNFDKTNIKVIRSSVFQLYLLSLLHYFDCFSSIINISGDFWPYQTKGKNFFPKSKVFSILHYSRHFLFDLKNPKLNFDNLTFQLNDGKNKGVFFKNESYLVQNQNGLQFLPDYTKKEVFYLTKLPYYKTQPESQIYQKVFCAIGSTVITNKFIESISEVFRKNPQLEATFWSTKRALTSSEEKGTINSGTFVKYKNLSFNDLFQKLTNSDFIFVWSFIHIDFSRTAVSTMLQHVFNYQLIPIVPKEIWVDSWKLDPEIALTYSTPEELKKVVISAMQLSDQKILEMKHQIFKYFQEQSKIMKSMVENQILT